MRMAVAKEWVAASNVLVWQGGFEAVWAAHDGGVWWSGSVLEDDAVGTAERTEGGGVILFVARARLSLSLCARVWCVCVCVCWVGVGGQGCGGYMCVWSSVCVF